ncbi:DUF1289 domain-containing protein [uncultured Pseudacidovorax sp.]|uniref:DUF1289 domain-containing protein n=1 Tax=uncultured Pseudacidovorax sp. TaxID=679313 RepID=UPI0025E83FE7|nr:DUF1289 domain-containing protein [uncultured Pseudacidovorax sp.]
MSGPDVDTPQSPLAARAALMREAVRQGLEPVPSPCVNVCRMSATSGLCEGCFRTIEEIRLWSRSTDTARLAVWDQVLARSAPPVG